MTETQETERVEIPVMDFTERLWLAMKRREIGALQMAERLEVSRQSLSNWLQGHTRPRPRDVKALARECHVPYEWLANGIVPGQAKIPEEEEDVKIPTAYYAPSLDDLEALADPLAGPVHTVVDPRQPHPGLAAFRTEIKSWWSRDHDVLPSDSSERSS